LHMTCASQQKSSCRQQCQRIEDKVRSALASRSVRPIASSPIALVTALIADSWVNSQSYS
jgi:hypothetical protein